MTNTEREEEAIRQWEQVIESAIETLMAGVRQIESPPEGWVRSEVHED